MKTEQLDWQHQEILTDHFRRLDVDISEYSFANLYLFRKLHEYEVLFDFEIFIKGRTRDGLSFLMPTIPLQKMDQGSLLALLSKDNFLYPIPEEWLQNVDLQHYRIDKSDADSDYCYSLSKIRTYPGRHLAGRRNLVKQLHAHFQVDSFGLNPRHAKAAQKVLEEWLGNSRQTAEETDYFPCIEGLHQLEKLNLSGRIYYIDEKPIGFVLGEPLNEKDYVIHFAKACELYKGIYQYMYQDCALHLEDHYAYINMEQDLGDPGLQQAKRAYMPDKRMSKLRLHRREAEKK